MMARAAASRRDGGTASAARHPRVASAMDEAKARPAQCGSQKSRRRYETNGTPRASAVARSCESREVALGHVLMPILTMAAAAVAEIEVGAGRPMAAKSKAASAESVLGGRCKMRLSSATSLFLKPFGIGSMEAT